MYRRVDAARHLGPHSGRPRMARTLPAPGRLLRDAWRRLAPLPGGRFLFSLMLGCMVPYTGASGGAGAEELEPGYARIMPRDRRGRAQSPRLDSRRGARQPRRGDQWTAMLTTCPTMRGASWCTSASSTSRRLEARLTAERRCRPPSGREETVTVTADVMNATGEVVARAEVRWLIRPLESPAACLSSRSPVTPGSASSSSVARCTPAATSSSVAAVCRGRWDRHRAADVLCACMAMTSLPGWRPFACSLQARRHERDPRDPFPKLYMRRTRECGGGGRSRAGSASSSPHSATRAGWRSSRMRRVGMSTTTSPRRSGRARRSTTVPTAPDRGEQPRRRHAGRLPAEAFSTRCDRFGRPVVAAGGVGDERQFCAPVGPRVRRGATGYPLHRDRRVPRARATRRRWSSPVLTTSSPRSASPVCPRLVINTPYVQRIGTRAGLLARMMLKGRRIKHLMRTYLRGAVGDAPEAGVTPWELLERLLAGR